MAGQGFHLGIAKIVANRQKREFTNQIKAGVLVVDALKINNSRRKYAHFIGGAGCIIPKLDELRKGYTIQLWDSKNVSTDIDMELFEAASNHIPECDYKDGIRIHLLADLYYDNFLQYILSDVIQEKDRIIINKFTGRKKMGNQLLKEVYSEYPLLDQITLDMADIGPKEIESTKEYISSVFTVEMSEYICKYLNFHSDLKCKNTKFFKVSDIEALVELTVRKTIEYINKIPLN